MGLEISSFSIFSIFGEIVVASKGDAFAASAAVGVPESESDACREASEAHISTCHGHHHHEQC